MGMGTSKMNVMRAQQCVSMSSVASHGTPSSVRSKYYSPYTPKSTYASPIGIPSSAISPIIQSHTSMHDHNTFCAAVDGGKEQKKISRKRKKSLSKRKSKSRKKKSSKKMMPW